MENISISEPEHFSPTQIPWIPVENCVCPLPHTNCFRPSVYSKPIVCVHESIEDIDAHLATALSSNAGLFHPFFWLYVLLIMVFVVQVDFPPPHIICLFFSLSRLLGKLCTSCAILSVAAAMERLIAMGMHQGVKKEKGSKQFFLPI